MTLSDGDRLGPWQIEGQLGRGPLTTVYRALDSRLGRSVALKVLADDLAAYDAFGDTLLDAACAGSTLSPRGTVPVLEVGRHSGIAFVCSGLIEGPDLGALLASIGHLEPARALVILWQVAEALDEAHARGIVHGGVKPTNVLMRWSRVRGAEDAYVSDFALAHLLRSAVEPLLGTRLGPVFYLSPEQIEGHDPGPRTDVYLLGCFLYECLTGRAPFFPTQDDALVSAHLGIPAPAPSAMRPELVAFDDVIRAAMAKSPDDRHQSCRHLLAHAQEALSRTEIPPRAIEIPPRAADSPTTGQSLPARPAPPAPRPPPAPTPAPRVTKGSDNILVSAVAALAALSLGILLLILISGSLQTEESLPDPSAARIEEVLRHELERNMGMFLAAQQQLVADDDIGGVEGLVPIHESTEDLQLGGIYTSASSSDHVSLVVAAYTQAADADVALETERAERGGTFSRQMTPSGLVATVLNESGDVSMIWHIDNVVFVITADDTATVQQFFDQLPKAVRLGPL